MSNEKLVELQLHRNDWHVQHARRVLQERAAAGNVDMSAAVFKLVLMLNAHEDVPEQLRAIWALHVMGYMDRDNLISQFKDKSEYVRAWSLRLLCESKELPDTALDRLRMLAMHDESALVRMHLASCLQRLKPESRWAIAEALMARSEDADDENIPLLVWYGIEPLVDIDRERFVALAGKSSLPLVAKYVGRRAAELPRAEDTLAAIVKQLSTTKGEVQTELLAGVIEGLAGRRTVPMPESWPAAYVSLKEVRDDRLHERALQLALIFDDPQALNELKAQAADAKVIPAVRNRALQALVSKKAKNLDALLLELLPDAAIARTALRGLAEYDHPQTATAIIGRYSAFDAAARQDALQTLSSRASWARKLIEALETKAIPRGDVTAYTARQLYSLNSEELNSRLKAAWGELRTSPAEKQQLVATFKRRFTLESIQRADRVAGRAIFQKSCANCHRIFDTGGKIGPDITGSQRTNLDYLLQTLIDPSAAVNKDYQMQVLQTIDGRTITGLVIDESKAAVTVQTVNEKLVVPVIEIEERQISPVSMMPDGLLQNLTSDQVRQLLAYLMGPEQVPLPDAGPASGK